jgi:CelD/BcsL family acetyltransferase involved in cellulose biosynthesis
LRIETAQIQDLGAGELATWRALQLAADSTCDPFFAPEWAQIIAAERRDARVAVLEDGGRVVGFLPIQRGSAFTAMGLGAPICDYDGLIASPNADIDLSALPRALKVDRIDFCHLPAEDPRYGAVLQVREEVLQADLTQWSSFVAARKAEGSSTLRNLDKKRRKFDREHGELTFEAFTKDREAFDLMLSWKQDQFARTGRPDVLAKPWCRAAHERALDASHEGMSGQMFTLRAGGRVVAALLALQGVDRLHAWMIAHDPEFGAYSPGAMVWHAMVEAAAAKGLVLLDFGCGDYPYKRFYATKTAHVGGGFVAKPSASAMVRSGLFAARRLMEKAPNAALAALPGKAMRRLDLYRALHSG